MPACKSVALQHSFASTDLPSTRRPLAYRDSMDTTQVEVDRCDDDSASRRCVTIVDQFGNAHKVPRLQFRSMTMP